MTFREIEHNSLEWRSAVRLREKILREPLGSKFTEEEHEEEKSYIQMAGFLEKELIATAVLVPKGKEMKMQRVVVDDKLRNKSIGSRMMEFCESLTIQKGFRIMYCHARESAVNFYLRNNYEKEDEYFDEDGIPHLKMKKNCS